MPILLVFSLAGDFYHSPVPLPLSSLYPMPMPLCSFILPVCHSHAFPTFSSPTSFSSLLYKPQKACQLPHLQQRHVCLLPSCLWLYLCLLCRTCSQCLPLQKKLPWPGLCLPTLPSYIYTYPIVALPAYTCLCLLMLSCPMHLCAIKRKSLCHCIMPYSLLDICLLYAGTPACCCLSYALLISLPHKYSLPTCLCYHSMPVLPACLPHLPPATLIYTTACPATCRLLLLCTCVFSSICPYMYVCIVYAFT